MPSAFHFLCVFNLPLTCTDFLRSSSSPDDAVAELATFLARLEAPILTPGLTDKR